MVTSVLLFFLPNALASSPPSNDSEASVFKVFDVLKNCENTHAFHSFFDFGEFFLLLCVLFILFSVRLCELFPGFGIIQYINSYTARDKGFLMWEFGFLWV